MYDVREHDFPVKVFPGNQVQMGRGPFPHPQAGGVGDQANVTTDSPDRLRFKGNVLRTVITAALQHLHNAPCLVFVQIADVKLFHTCFQKGQGDSPARSSGAEQKNFPALKGNPTGCLLYTSRCV